MLIDKLDTKKNLLAFSGGVDSTSLFFILLEHNIPFDIAIVNYNQRTQSTQEVEHALKLAKQYKKICFVKEYDKEKFSEKLARDFRYQFFDEIIENKNYETLITAHQLNDKIEWFIMQLAKGAGVVELLGLEEYSKRKKYQIFRPLLEYTKEELLVFLKEKKIKYFIDETNKDPKYQRNYIRKKYANEFVNEYKEGIRKSFLYLHNDVDSINRLYSVKKLEQMSVATFINEDDNIKLRFIDKELKQRGVLVTKETKDEILRQKEIVVSHTIAIAINNNKVYITPYCEFSMDKKFKEWCRLHIIPKNVRAYLSTLSID
ncbi:MAG TPA: tRNA lysidine(34) synthetase TilS, partial [Arcobacter sp.]|nr:tRNA lysidine(34) synthetase TilS [Arcobacter sp.]